MKLLEKFVEALFWFANFISPAAFFGLVAAFIYYAGSPIIAALIGALGIFLGIRFANYISKDQGSSNFYSRVSKFDDVKPVKDLENNESDKPSENL